MRAAVAIDARECAPRPRGVRGGARAARVGVFGARAAALDARRRHHRMRDCGGGGGGGGDCNGGRRH